MSKWQLIKCFFGFHKRKITYLAGAEEISYMECKFCKKYLGESFREANDNEHPKEV